MWDLFAILGIATTTVIILGAVGYGLLYLWAKAMGMPD